MAEHTFSRQVAEHNPLWAEALLWALRDEGEVSPVFDPQPARLPPGVCARAAELFALPEPLADFGGEYLLLRPTSGGEAVFGKGCNVAARHENDCEQYIFHLDDPPRWVVGPTPGVDRVSLHVLAPPGTPVQGARNWLGFIDDQWEDVQVRVRCVG